ncbi:hypothetical protein ACFSQ7_48535 [Paenibacillus rhizoplanae]
MAMNERLLLGRSIDTGSWVHKLDARSKITGMLLYVAIILLSHFVDIDRAGRGLLHCGDGDDPHSTEIFH